MDGYAGKKLKNALNLADFVILNLLTVLMITHNKAIKYRPEIDGLRAIAVIPVILFHAGFSLFSGGFVGVDVFFVISGYLITSILLRELERNEFSISGFYERRARRILPALFFVIAFFLPFSWFWMEPEELKAFGLSIVSAVLFSSNVYFFLNSDYFSPAAEEQPLLHTWSLAVEEQFYLFFPLVLLFLWKRGEAKTLLFISVALVFTLFLSEFMWRYDANANFYLFPTRIWELLCGAVLAFPQVAGFLNKTSFKFSNVMSTSGLFLILYSIFFYDESVPSPGILMFVPVLGAALVIGFTRGESLLGRVLSSKLLVGFGLLSYSAYLWHQPLFAFARLRVLGEPDIRTMVFLVVLTFLFSFITWKYVESPFRKGGSKRGRVFFFSASGVAALLLVGAVFHAGHGFPARFGMPDSLVKSFSRVDAKCFDRPYSHEVSEWLCTIGDAGDKGDVFLMAGDSHMYSMIPVFDNWAKFNSFTGLYAGYSGCPPLLSIYALRPDQLEKSCHELNDRIFNYVKEHNISNVVLAARWTYYTDGGYSGKNFSYLGLSPDEVGSADSSVNAFFVGLGKTIQAYADIGVKVHLIAQVPQQLYHPGEIYKRAYEGQEKLDLIIQDLSVSRDKHLTLQSLVNGHFKTLEEKYPESLEVIDFTDFFCDEARCLVGENDKSFYFDGDHLSEYGSIRLADVLGEKINI